MRAIHSFVLKILADANEPDALRGSLRPVSGEAEYPFTDGLGLLTLLTQFVRHDSDSAARHTGEDEAQVAHEVHH